MDVKRTRWALIRVLALVVALALVLAACGGDDDGGNTTGSTGEPTGETSGESTGPTAETGGVENVTLSIGVIPIADVAPLYLGIDQGFFEEEGLTIEPQFAEGGAAIIPAVVAGDNQIGFSNTTSLIIARSQNVPVQIVSQGVVGGASPDEAWDAVLVPADSPIESPEDLAGATIAVNTLNNIGPLTINTALDAAGVDFTTVEYVEVPFPEMLAALESGDVDAVWVVEPFVTAGLGGGARAILHPYEETEPNLTVATYFSSTDYIEQNPDVIDAFVAAMTRSLDYAAQNPDAARAIVGEYTEIPPEAIEAMTLPQWSSDLGIATIERMVALAEQYGFVEAAPDLSELIRQR
jgi:NitT/TauT family transport system substrate-binding protein